MTDAEIIKELEERVAFLEEYVMELAYNTCEYHLGVFLGCKILLRPKNSVPESADFLIVTDKPGNV